MKDVYDLKSVKLPYLSGGMLKLFASLIEGPLAGLLMPSLFASSGITWFRKQNFEEAPTHHPIHFAGVLQKEAAAVARKEWTIEPANGKGFHFATIHDFAAAYRDGRTTPEEVAARLLGAIEASNKANPPLRAVIAVQREDVLQQAKESTKRVKEGRALSLFDGVPVVIKDEMDVAGYHTTVGTAFLGKTPAEQDAEVVARLRNAGAIIVGKANMHEIGINVTGLNPHHGATRNPYNVDHYTGGSSSGSATAVAAGLVPVAIGADGGGSIRIPASFCGLVGLKATFGRVSEHGAAALDWSIAHIGPLAASATDAALTYAVIAGPDPQDPNSLHQPLPTLEGLGNKNLHGLKLGVYWPWFRHADAEVVAACEVLLKQFDSMGAEICEVTIPDLEANRIAHMVTIVSEMAQAMEATYQEHHRQHGLDVRVNLAIARQLSSRDYLLAQRIRTRMIHHFEEAFRRVDMVITPTTGIAAPKIKKAALPIGDSDNTITVEIMRFVTAANLTGYPAISFPAGYTTDGMPIGMQAIGRAWEESTLLRLALAAEQVVEKKEPQVHFRILE
jgi:Asp-tRNA(Asn)/Glu-tRNA(Gln) amidotransferase A subunit family amidase